MVETAGVHHPWRAVRDALPDWEVEFCPLPDRTYGDTDGRSRTIRIDAALGQAQRRCTIEHERIHARDGDIGPQPPWREAEVEAEAARNLIPLDALVDACKWTLDRHELAEELWVDLAVLDCRLANLTDDERRLVREALAERDYHLEGWAEG